MQSEAEKLIERIQRLKMPNRDIDWDIAEALGGMVRRVSRLGLTGRTKGSYRAFFPYSDPRKGSAIPYYTKDASARERAIARIRALSPEAPQPEDKEARDGR